MECTVPDQHTSNAFQTFLHNNQEIILTLWNEDKTVRSLFSRLKITPEEHKSNIAAPVLNNLILMLSSDEMPADCPIMRQLVETFYNRGLSVEDVFLNCTGLKNAIVSILFQTPGTGIDITYIMNILDQNLFQILAIYTQKLNEQKNNLKIHSQIIEEHVLLTITDINGIITHVTDAFCELTGYSKEELLGKSHTIIRHPEVKDALFRGMWKRILAGKTWKGKIKNLKKDGGEFIANTEIIPVKDDAGDILEFIAIRNDVTDKELSALDPLTALYNRRKFDMLMRSYFSREIVLSLIVIDLDHFKNINDTYGHAAGDDVLKQFAKIVTAHTRMKDICARWSGEEFVILLPDTSCEIAHTIAERIRKTTEKSPILEGFPVQCSIGVTEQTKTDTIQSFFERADRFMYQAKQAGRNRTVTDKACVSD